VELARDLEWIASAAAPYGNGDALVAVLATEPAEGTRCYLCAFDRADGVRSWIALDHGGEAVTSRGDVRAAASIAALCEVAEESAFPGDLDELRAELVSLRIAESPPGIEEAEAAALALQHALGVPPNLASPARLSGKCGRAVAEPTTDGITTGHRRSHFPEEGSAIGHLVLQAG